MKYMFLRYPGGLEKALTLSYDDGSRHDLRLIDTADKYGIKVTLNVCSDCLGGVDNDWNLTAEALKAIQARGHELAIHTARHTAMGCTTTLHGIREVLECKLGLEAAFGGIIRGMAYADSGIRKLHAGVSKAEIAQYLKSLDIAYARSLGADHEAFGGFDLPEDVYAWIPTTHHANPKLMEHLDTFLNAKLRDYVAARAPMVFYLWGHSFEFDRENNWEVLEQFCAAAGGHDDIWYATNIEIIEYLEAYRALKFNAAGTLVYNPTVKPVWFEADLKPYCIQPGETLEV